MRAYVCVRACVFVSVCCVGECAVCVFGGVEYKSHTLYNPCLPQAGGGLFNKPGGLGTMGLGTGLGGATTGLGESQPSQLTPLATCDM